MSKLKFKKSDSGIAFTVKAVPNSSKTCVQGLQSGMLKVKLSSPPEKGKANKELIKFLAKKLGIKKNQISITTGETSPQKKIQIVGCDEATLAKVVT
jgi:hypothetical protein